MVYLVLLKKNLFPAVFLKFSFLNAENFAGKGCPVSAIFIAIYCHLTHVRVAKVGGDFSFSIYCLLQFKFVSEP